MATSMTDTTTTPYRQIRAQFDDDTITVYQAYSAAIAAAAVEHQRLDASPEFLLSRMTWIKPSWCWMMYRSGYSLKDSRQSRILALKMRRDQFETLLLKAAVCEGETLTPEQRSKPVRVQWDPERGPDLRVLPYRSLQVGIGRQVVREWIENGIVEIEDVTERALSLKSAVEGGEVSELDLRDKGLCPVERVFEVSEELKRVLEMDR